MKTRVTIRAKAEDAKFVGTSMGGALVVVKDFFTGEVLAKGVTHGSTGDTQKIMKTPWVRGMQLADETTAKFVAELELEEPRLIEILVYAPYAQTQAMAKASVTTWVVPGKHIEGDGIIIDIPGLVVRVSEPTPHTFLKAPAKVNLKASVTPMCGCPVDMKTFWPPDAYEVGAFIKKDGRDFDKVNLQFCGETNCFATEISLQETGEYEFVVYAYDPKTGNTGVDKSSVVVTK